MRRGFLCHLTAALAVCCLLTGCGDKSDIPTPHQAADGTLSAEADVLQYRQPDGTALVAVFDTTAGAFSTLLFPDEAPQAVQNFVTLAKQGSYDGLPFHRVVQDFIVQSGETDANGGQSIWGQPFPAETSDLLHHYTGALAMAGADANQSQFFVVNCSRDSVPEVLQQQMRQLGWSEEVISAYAQVGGAPYLDNVYTVFGQVFCGMDTVRAIGQTGNTLGRVSQPVTLNSVQITTFDAWCAAHPEAELSFYTPPPVTDSATDDSQTGGTGEGDPAANVPTDGDPAANGATDGSTEGDVGAAEGDPAAPTQDDAAANGDAAQGDAAASDAATPPPAEGDATPTSGAEGGNA